MGLVCWWRFRFGLASLQRCGLALLRGFIRSDPGGRSRGRGIIHAFVFMVSLYTISCVCQQLSYKKIHKFVCTLLCILTVQFAHTRRGSHRPADDRRPGRWSCGAGRWWWGSWLRIGAPAAARAAGRGPLIAARRGGVPRVGVPGRFAEHRRRAAGGGPGSGRAGPGWLPGVRGAPGGTGGGATGPG